MEENMAIRKRAGRAKPYQVYWNNPFTGKRESASFETRGEAEKEDSLIKHRLRFERESFAGEPTVEKVDFTLEAVVIAYIREKQFDKKGVCKILDAMRLPLSMFGGKALQAITTADLEAALEQHQAKGVKPVTVRGRMKVLRAVLRWASEKDYCQPLRFPKLPPAIYEKLVPPTASELEAIMAAASEHIRRVVVIGAQCGVRVGPCELFRLTWHDVDLDLGILRVHGSKKNLAAPWREVPIRESLLPLFRAWHEADAAAGVEYLIHYDGKPVTSIKGAWHAALQRAGITRRIRPYDLRHAFATELIAAGVDIGTVAKLMGHSGPAMLLTHYQYVMDKQKKAAVEALPQLARVPNSMCPTNCNANPLQ